LTGLVDTIISILHDTKIGVLDILYTYTAIEHGITRHLLLHIFILPKMIPLLNVAMQQVIYTINVNLRVNGIQALPPAMGMHSIYVL